MKTITPPTESGNRYDAAHKMHHTEQNPGGAVGLYAAIIAEYPDAPEAGYCQSQVMNIVKSVVPKDELLEVHVGLIRTHLAQKAAAAA